MQRILYKLLPLAILFTLSCDEGGDIDSSGRSKSFSAVPAHVKSFLLEESRKVFSSDTSDKVFADGGQVKQTSYSYFLLDGTKYFLNYSSCQYFPEQHQNLFIVFGSVLLDNRYEVVIGIGFIDLEIPANGFYEVAVIGQAYDRERNYYANYGGPAFAKVNRAANNFKLEFSSSALETDYLQNGHIHPFYEGMILSGFISCNEILYPINS